MESESEHSSGEFLLSQETYRALTEELEIFNQMWDEVGRSDSPANENNSGNQVESEIETVYVMGINQGMEGNHTGVPSVSVPGPFTGNETINFNQTTGSIVPGTAEFPELVSQHVTEDSIPVTANWEGHYYFNVSCEPQEKQTKSTSWTYAEDRAKLYVNMNVICPFRIYAAVTPPFGSYVRATAVFSQHQHSREVVERCINHSSPTDETNKDHIAPKHLIRCNHPLTEYLEDPISKRQSVRVPYKEPEAGMEFTTYHMKFMCLGSCVGGLNRRPIKVVFTLENGNVVLGRKSMDVRICACPGRDRRTDEKSTSNIPKQPKTGSQGVKRDAVTGIADGFSVGPKLKKPKQEKNDNETFQITVRGRENYDILMKIKVALELLSQVSEHPNLGYDLTPPKMKRKKPKSSDESEG